MTSLEHLLRGSKETENDPVLDELKRLGCYRGMQRIVTASFYPKLSDPRRIQRLRQTFKQEQHP